MALNLKNRNFLTLLDFTPEEIRLMLDVSHEYKREPELEPLLLWRLEIWEFTQNF